jgi:hypothetical protein
LSRAMKPSTLVPIKTDAIILKSSLGKVRA